MRCRCQGGFSVLWADLEDFDGDFEPCWVFDLGGIRSSRAQPQVVIDFFKVALIFDYEFSE